MPFVPLHDHLPELAKRESRVVVVPEGNDLALPADHYLFAELFCDESGCDCRRVMVMVRSLARNQVEAVLAYGWEDLGFYARWLGEDDPELAAEVKGPSLNLGSPESELAPAILELFTQLLLPDRHYVERLRRHYHVFRQLIEARARPRGSGRKIGRNEKCPCGSGRKFKACCAAVDAPIRQAATVVGSDWSWKGDMERIVEQAAARMSHVIQLGPLTMFSTHTGDAWLLDPRDRTAVPLARDGERLPVRIVESDRTLGVEWTHDYEVGDESFLVTERCSGQQRILVGYHPELLAMIARA